MEAIQRSRRHEKRLERIRQAPGPVQRACWGKRLRMIYAERVSRLPPATQETIARRITAGEDPNSVVQEYLPPRNYERRPIDQSVARCVCRLADATRPLAARLPEVFGLRDLAAIRQYQNAIVECQSFLLLLHTALQQAEQATGSEP